MEQLDTQDLDELLSLVGKAFMDEMLSVGVRRITTRMVSLKDLVAKLIYIKGELK